MATANVGAGGAGAGAGAGADPLVGTRSGASSTLSPWAATYVTDLLSKAKLKRSAERITKSIRVRSLQGNPSYRQKRFKALAI